MDLYIDEAHTALDIFHFAAFFQWIFPRKGCGLRTSIILSVDKLYLEREDPEENHRRNYQLVYTNIVHHLILMINLWNQKYQFCFY